MSIRAVCVRCGSEKGAPWKICSSCGFRPEEDSDAMIKSVYLSAGRFEGRTEEQKVWQAELSRLVGERDLVSSYSYDEGEVERLERQMRDIGRINPWPTVLRLFLPAIVVISVIVALLIILKLTK